MKIVIVSSSSCSAFKREFHKTAQKTCVWNASFLSEIRKEQEKMKVLEINSATEVQIKAKQKTKSECASFPIRIRPSTRSKLDELMRRANKQKLGRKIKADDLICFSLALLTDEHLEQICNKALTNKDRLELLFRRVAKERKGLTRDEFFGLLIDGKVTV